jgi:DNA-binding IclR family transcriptional regulator
MGRSTPLPGRRRAWSLIEEKDVVVAQGLSNGSAPEFRPVKSAYRALDVLEAMASGPSTLSDLSRKLGIPNSSLHGLLRTLTNRGWVTTMDRGSRYRLGLRALQVGARFIDEDEMVSYLAPSLDRLAAVTGETVQQARLDGDQVVYLAKRDSPHPVRLISTIGSRLPAHATALGKALLAAWDDAALRDLLEPPLAALTGHTIVEWEPLRAELAATRARGYAIDNGEAAEGLRCFAVTVPTPPHLEQAAGPTDAISVSVPAYRLDEQRERELVAALLGEQSRMRGLAPAR